MKVHFTSSLGSFLAIGFGHPRFLCTYGKCFWAKVYVPLGLSLRKYGIRYAIRVFGYAIRVFGLGWPIYAYANNVYAQAHQMS